MSSSEAPTTDGLPKKRSQDRDISPPPLKRKRPLPAPAPAPAPSSSSYSPLPTSAAIEAGRAHIASHLAYFTAHLTAHTIHPFPALLPRLAMPSYAALYTASRHSPRGAHFVVHQHDHPVAGTHYDLRLQVNGGSSASWAVMKGLPGDANGRRGVGRNATETRVHCLWNHLVETASAETGSLLVWDAGRYEVLGGRATAETESEGGEGEGDGGEGATQQERLARAFARRRIRVRLHGARLPSGYTVYLRLSAEDDIAGRVRAARPAVVGPRKRTASRRRRKDADVAETSEEDGEESRGDAATPGGGDGERRAAEGEAGLSAAEREAREREDEAIRENNAYPGASNTVGSVHQRRWFLSLDRTGSGFVKQRRDGKTVWVRDADQGQLPQDDGGDTNRWSFPFYVRGAEHERSVVTGRLGDEILRDEGVTGFVRRKGWRPILD